MKTIGYKGNSEKTGIYIIRNNINHKVYVGSTKRSFHSRKTKHINGLKSNSHFNNHLQSAFNKYGEDEFSFEVIFIIDDDVEFFENYFINLFRSNVRDFGYNIAVSSKYNTGYSLSEEAIKQRSEYKKNKAFVLRHSKVNERGINKPVMLFDRFGELIKEYDSCTMLCNEKGWSKSSVSTSLSKGKHYYKGFLICFSSDIPNKDKMLRQVSQYEPKPVYMFSLSGMYIQSFSSAKEASLFVGCKDAEIRMCCIGKRSRIKNYKFSYEREG